MDSEILSENISIHPDANRAASDVVERLCMLVRVKPEAVLGLATGATMEPVYQGLVQAHRDGLSFAKITTFNLDEYAGLAPSHPASYHATMQRLFFDHVDVTPGRTHLPRGDTGNHKAEAIRYEALLAKAGPVDLQLLGIGRNGHVGFNEPGATGQSRTHVTDLHAETLSSNKGFFEDGQVMPTQAVTMGVASIMAARSIVLLATGAAKAPALKAALSGPIGPACPASYLRAHDSVHWICDQAAVAR